MNRSVKIIFAIAVIGTIACLLSFLVSLKNDNLAGVIMFLLSGLFCLSAAVKIIRHKRI